MSLFCFLLGCLMMGGFGWLMHNADGIAEAAGVIIRGRKSSVVDLSTVPLPNVENSYIPIVMQHLQDDDDKALDRRRKYDTNDLIDKFTHALDGILNPLTYEVSPWPDFIRLAVLWNSGAFENVRVPTSLPEDWGHKLTEQLRSDPVLKLITLFDCYVFLAGYRYSRSFEAMLTHTLNELRHIIKYDDQRITVTVIMQAIAAVYDGVFVDGTAREDLIQTEN